MAPASAVPPSAAARRRIRRCGKSGELQHGERGSLATEIRVAHPAWLHPKPGDAWPLLAIAAGGEDVEVELLAAGELVALRLVGDAFDLNGARAIFVPHG